MEQAPVFVKVENYKDVLDVIELIRSKVDEAKNTLAEINELRNEEDAEIDLWSSTLDEIEKKVHSIDRALFEPESTW